MDRGYFLSSLSNKISDYIKWAGLSDVNCPDLEISGAQIDSRRVIEGNVFFALSGEFANGEDYILDAFKNGASFVFASESCDIEDKRIIKVPDALEALVKIATAYRRELGAKVLAITGSVGKTSTKNFCYDILSQKYKTHMSPGNYNTVTGLSMAILSAPRNTEIMVLEHGVDTIGEMASLVDITDPDVAIITNIGESHLERFKTRENIYREKIGIVDKFSPNSSLVLKGSDDFLDNFESQAFGVYRVFEESKTSSKWLEGRRSGVSLISNIEVSLNGTLFDISFDGEKHRCRTQLIGGHFAINAGLSIIACLKFGLNFDDIMLGLSLTRPEPLRFDVKEFKGIVLINDAYNSSLTSIKASLKSAAAISEGRLIAVLGDVLESGEDPASDHIEIGTSLLDIHVDHVFFYGNLMRHAHKVYKKPSSYHLDFEELCDSLCHFIKGGDTVIIKGSRAMKMERLEDFLRGSLCII